MQPTDQCRRLNPSLRIYMFYIMFPKFFATLHILRVWV